MGVFNEFFDLCNGNFSMQAAFTRNPLLAPYTSESDDRFKLFDKIIHYFEEWKTEAKGDRRLLPSEQTLVGIEMTCRSMQAAIKFLLQEGQQFVMSRIFCQDPLEQHFSKQRGALGGNRNPTVEQYLHNERNLHVLGNIRFKRKRANTEDTSRITKADCTPLPKRPKVLARRGLLESFKL